MKINVTFEKGDFDSLHDIVFGLTGKSKTHTEETIKKVTENNKRTIKFSDEELKFIIESFNNKFSRRQILISLNKLFGYKINLTSTGIINRVLKENKKKL